MVLLRYGCDMLCTSGFVDDIMTCSLQWAVHRYEFRYEGPISLVYREVGHNSISYYYRS